MPATFPALIGAAWDIKKKVLWSVAVDTSASGSEFRTGRWNLPHYEFQMKFTYLSQTDCDTLEDFINAQQGEFVPFLLTVANDFALSNVVCSGLANGVNKNFQIPLPAQSQVVTATIKDNGAAAGANAVSASGLITFTTAPVSGHAITATVTYAYLVRFKDPVEINQFMHRMYEVSSIKFVTVR
jgi:hypothetical protein